MNEEDKIWCLRRIAHSKIIEYAREYIDLKHNLYLSLNRFVWHKLLNNTSFPKWATIKEFGDAIDYNVELIWPPIRIKSSLDYC